MTLSNTSFENRSLRANCVYNVVGTHFVVSLNDLAMKEDTNVRFIDFIRRDIEMTMALILEGGLKARLETLFTVYSNNRHLHPLQGIPVTTPGLFYRSERIGRMDRHLFPGRPSGK